MSDEEPTDDGQDDVPEAVFPSKGPNREGMVGDYLPEQEDWEAKTNLDLSDPAAIAALQNFGRMFPEVDDLQPLIDDFLEHFLKSKTSVRGKSRDEYRKIFMAMYGKGDDGDGNSTLQLVAPEED